MIGIKNNFIIDGYDCVLPGLMVMEKAESGYRSLDIWKMAQEIIRKIHLLSMNLPYHEKFEEGAQIRRSSKSISSNIVEGYGRRNYKNDFIKFLIYAQASTDETKDHLDILYNTGSIDNPEEYNIVRSDLEILSKKIYRFTQSVKRNHKS